MRDILTQKTYKKYDRISRYANFPYYYNITDFKYQYGTTAQLDETTPYILYKVQKNDTLDYLALINYNNPTYFWVIADFNRIQDPYTALTPGDIIKIPVFSSIRFKG